mmetsp:Transcript_72474/g.207917  ORF Transcript_72474/g.207917 Transcript_72474/m.207917 type:complete len:341 (-) Transcript_72474:146-1168(-)
MEGLTRESLLSVGAYMACSSMALVSNKVTISHFHTPASIFLLQILVTIGFIKVGQALSWLEADRLSWSNVKVFIPYICSFVISLYSNGRALANANVETIIVFRACSPVCVSVLDWMFLGRELPNVRSVCALLGVLGGAVGYVLCDSQFAMNGITAYFWVMTNLAGIVFEMTYGKRLISLVTFNSPVWGATLYTNTLAALPMLSVAVSSLEFKRFTPGEAHDVTGLLWLAVSCVIGVGISWSGWNCRSKISATTYTLVGVICKFVSVILNMLLWDKHATPVGMLMLSVCLVASSLYQQAPMRSGEHEVSTSKSPKVAANSAPEYELVGLTAPDVDEDDDLG